MRPLFNRVAFVGAITITWCGLGCTADIHDNTLTAENPNLQFTTGIDVQHVTAGESVPVQMSTDKYYLVPPDQTPPAEHVDDAAYFKIFLDDIGSEPLVITASTSVSVKISETTPPGNHKLRCKIFKHDGTPTDVETDIAITVVVSVTVGTGGTSGSGGMTSTGGVTSTGGTTNAGGVTSSGGMTSTGGITSMGGTTSTGGTTG